MSTLSRIERLRAQLKSDQENKGNGNRQFQNNRNIYPFWNMKEGERCVIRILPDLNEENEKVFFVDRLEHNLSINGKTRKIPCRKMHGQSCPICEQSQAYYKMEDEENGKMYYRKKQSMLRILVLEDPLPPQEDGTTFVGKTCNAQFANELMTLIKQEIGDPELGDFLSLTEGTDFVITKTLNPKKFAVYNVGTGFARRPSAVPQEYRDNVELIDLKTLLPNDFGLEKVTNMLNAHNTGEDYEEEDSGNAKKPVEKKAVDTSAERLVERKEPAKRAPEPEVETDDYDDGNDGDDDATVVETKEAVKEEKSEVAAESTPKGLLAELRRKRDANAARR
jgi:hypothetical protein